MFLYQNIFWKTSNLQIIKIFKIRTIFKNPLNIFYENLKFKVYADIYSIKCLSYYTRTIK